MTVACTGSMSSNSELHGVMAFRVRQEGTAFGTFNRQAREYHDAYL